MGSSLVLVASEALPVNNMELCEITYDSLDKHCIGTHSVQFMHQFDKLGQESGQAQQLKGPITSAEKLLGSDGEVAIVAMLENGDPIGYAKYGFRNLYIYRKDGKVVERSQAPCLLDFYVSESMQRRGIGLSLFRRTLEGLGLTDPRKVAYDRPSPKLVAFLARHFDLHNGDLQPNRFMIFESFL